MTGWRDKLSDVPSIDNAPAVMGAARRNLLDVLQWVRMSDPPVEELACLLYDCQLASERLADLHSELNDRLDRAAANLGERSLTTVGYRLEQRVGGWHAEQRRDWQ